MTGVHQQKLQGWICRELSHLKDEDVRALAQIVERLVEAYQPERIYLFGSKAHGDAGPETDYDILVPVEHPTEPR